MNNSLPTGIQNLILILITWSKQSTPRQGQMFGGGSSYGDARAFKHRLTHHRLYVAQTPIPFHNAKKCMRKQLLPGYVQPQLCQQLLQTSVNYTILVMLLGFSISIQ